VEQLIQAVAVSHDRAAVLEQLAVSSAFGYARHRRGHRNFARHFRDRQAVEIGERSPEDLVWTLRPGAGRRSDEARTENVNRQRRNRPDTTPLAIVAKRRRVFAPAGAP